MNTNSHHISAVHLTVTDANEGQRLDNFLFSYLKDMPKSHVYRVIRKGEVRVNGKRKKPETRLEVGDNVRIPPRTSSHNHEAVTLTPSEKILKQVQKAIVFEDDGLIVLNKPAGLAVHGGSGLSYGAIEAVRALYPKNHALALVHRLDRETSGCLLIAKKRSMLTHLQKLFRENAIQKVYLTVLSGHLKTKLTITEKLQKFVLQSGERMVHASEEGKPSETQFIPVRYDASLNMTLVKAYPKTGRTHQIRVHAKCMGHPIIGDEKYGEKEANKAARQAGLNRLFLHALELHYRDKADKPVHLRVPTDKDYSFFTDELKEQSINEFTQ